MEGQLLAVKDIAEAMERKLAGHRNMPYRVQTVAVRLLAEHTVFCRGLADALALKCLGRDREAKERFFSFMDQFGARELSMERYYDHFEVVHSLKIIFNTVSEYDQCKYHLTKWKRPFIANVLQCSKKGDH